MTSSGNVCLTAVAITSGYTESEMAFYNPMLWYERPQKRVHSSLEPYGMMDYYGHMQPPSAKYMKPEPVAYYQYADDPERYQANITVSVQSQVHAGYPVAPTSTVAYGLSPHYNYSSSPNPVTNPNTPYYSSPADTCNVAYTLCSSHPPTCTDPSLRTLGSCSPVRSSTEPEASSSMGDHLNTPLTPPLSVSPGPHPVRTSPTPPHCISPIPHTYLEKENTIGYRSGSSSPCCLPDCDSTTATELLESSVIPCKLPLQMLSDLSEGLPLPGM